MRRERPLALALVVLLAPVVRAADSPWAGGPSASAAARARPASVPSDEELERSAAVIGEIVIHGEDIFDMELPEENRGLFRLANRLHVNTRPAVVRQDLLFESGDLYSARLVRESERLLRGRKYLYDCVIRPLRFEDNRVDLEVWVRDVWTLKLSVSLSRSGGVNKTRFTLQDNNLLGSGSSVTLGRESDVDRTSLSARYEDANVLGSRVRVSFVYSDDSDGNRTRLQAGRPFYSLDTRWAAGMDGESSDRVEPLYSLGEIAEEFRQQKDRFEVSGGLSKGLLGGRARRLIFGLTYSRDRFAPEPGGAPVTTLPEDRTFAYPWIGAESVVDAYATTRNFDQLTRTEDVALGHRYQGRLGFAARDLGSDRDAAIFAAGSESGWAPAAGHTLLLSTAVAGRYAGRDFENLVVGGSARYYRRNLANHLFFATVEGTVASNLDRDNQLLLGGDSGLRGYPLRYQDGDARFLATVEQRFFTGFYPLRLFYVGAAVFADVGRTWADAGALSPNLGWLRDVGVGLRLGSSRSGFGSVVHIDLAFPLDGDPSIDSVQWLVTARETL